MVGTYILLNEYLGVLFNCNGRFRKGELELHQQAQRAIYSLVGLCRKFDLPVGMQLELSHDGFTCHDLCSRCMGKLCNKRVQSVTVEISQTYVVRA